jgi:hypothetical protein
MRSTWRFNARVTPIRANVLGPPDVATRIEASIAACHSSTCNRLGEFGEAASLWAAYATAQLYVIYLLGSAAGAANVAANAANGVTRALAEVAKAEAALREGCSDATALAACLATPSPCSGVP